MKHGVRCIAFVSPLGGTGQTTVVANLASLWRAAGTPCLAVDLCAQNSLGLHLGQSQPPAQGWATDVLAGQWWAQSAQENSAPVQWVPFGSASTPSQLAELHRSLAQDPHWLATCLSATALEDNSLVLLDAPAWPQVLASQALQCADLVVVCLDASPRATGLQQHVQALLAQASSGARTAVLATRFNPRRESQQQAMQSLQRQWSGLLAPYVLHDDESVPAALAASHCAAVHAPQSQAAHDLHGIAHWLLEHCALGGPLP
jgi:cellulose synthase operon protein YhjQ